MNKSFSLQQIQKTGQLDANLQSRQYKLNLMADLMRMKYGNPIMKQSEITKTKFNNNSHREPDVKRLQMTSNDRKTTQTNTKSNKKRKIF